MPSGDLYSIQVTSGNNSYLVLILDFVLTPPPPFFVKSILFTDNISHTITRFSNQ